MGARSRHILVTLLIVGLVLAFGLRYAMSFGDAHEASRLKELDAALRDAIDTGAHELRSRLRSSRDGNEDLPFGARSAAMVRSVSDAMQRAERLEMVEGREEEALESYLEIILDTEDPSELVAARRNAARIQARRGALREAQATLEAALSVGGASAQERRLAREALRSYRRGEVSEVAEPESDRSLQRALARVLAAADLDQVVRVDRDRVAWGVTLSGSRPVLAIASLRAVLDATLPGVSDGRWTLTGGADGRLLVPPFPLARLRPSAARRHAVARAASAQRRWHALPAILASLFLLGGSFLVWHWRSRRERDEKRKAAFVCAVTHELMTPIANISLYAETLRDHGATDPESVPGFAGIVLDEVERLRLRVREILDVASGRQRIPESDQGFDPRPIVRDVLAEYADRLRPAAMPCRVDISSECGRVRGTGTLFRRALEGIIDNAVKFARGEPVLVRMERSGEAVVLEIEDGGPGIPASERRRVFEPFARLDADLERGSPGTGLGLTLVRQCVEECGGEVSIEEGERGGARFRLTLAAEPADA